MAAAAVLTRTNLRIMIQGLVSGLLWYWLAVTVAAPGSEFLEADSEGTNHDTGEQLPEV